MCMGYFGKANAAGNFKSKLYFIAYLKMLYVLNAFAAKKNVVAGFCFAIPRGTHRYKLLMVWQLVLVQLFEYWPYLGDDEYTFKNHLVLTGL